MHPARRALIKTQSGKTLGWLGEINKKTIKHFGLKNVRVAGVEFDIDEVRGMVRELSAFEPLAKFPFVERDLSMIVDNKLKVGEVEDFMFKVGGQLLQDVDLFDLYFNKETGEKSMAFHLLFGDKEKTLQAKEVDEQVNKIIQQLESELGVEVRK